MNIFDTGPKDWQYRGKNGQVVMFGITEARARDYAKRFGGTAEPMPER